MDAESKNGKQAPKSLGLVVGIGASAGGLDALNELFSALPSHDLMTLILTQHSDPRHVTMLADILRPRSRFPVEPARDGLRLVSNHVYTGPTDQDLAVEDGVLRFVPRTLTNRLHMPVDTF